MMDNEWLKRYYRGLGYSEERITSILRASEEREKEKEEEVRRLRT